MTEYMRGSIKEPVDKEDVDVTLERYYVPFRQYDDIEVRGLRFQAFATVDKSILVKEDWIDVTEIGEITMIDDEGCEHIVPDAFLDSRPAESQETWRALIEREICLQAEKLPKREWKEDLEYAE
jgi:hypothetical protein